MKKALSLILVLALAVSMLCTTAFAAGSKTDVFKPTGSGSKSDVFGASGSGSKSSVFDGFQIKFTETESELDAITAEEMADALAEAEEAGIDAEKLVVVAQRDFAAEEYPVVVRFYGEGTEDVTICQFVKLEGTENWALAYTGLAGEWEVEFEAAGTYAIAVVID